MKVLVIRFSSIGDIVLTTPVIRACKVQLDAEIHLLTKKQYAGILDNNPYLQKIHSFSDDLREVREILVNEDFDFVIDLHKNLRSLRIKRWLKKPYGSFPKLNIKKWLLVNFKINRMPDLHIVDRYFMAYPKLINDGKGLDYFIKNESRVDLGIQQYICIVLGATYYTKRIPEMVLRKILSKINGPIVLVGGPEEKTLGSVLEEDFASVINACGKYSIDESASIIQGSEYVITSDTGMMHIAAALKKRIVVVWGNTIPELGMGPYKTEHFDGEVPGLSCRPCSKLGKDACPKGHFKCMMDQSVEEITQSFSSGI